MQANVVSAEHSKVEAKIYGELSSKTQYWKKDNYIKSMMGGKHKITKKAEDGFEKVISRLHMLTKKITNEYRPKSHGQNFMEKLSEVKEGNQV